MFGYASDLDFGIERNVCYWCTFPSELSAFLCRQRRREARNGEFCREPTVLRARPNLLVEHGCGMRVWAEGDTKDAFESRFPPEFGTDGRREGELKVRLPLSWLFSPDRLKRFGSTDLTVRSKQR